MKKIIMNKTPKELGFWMPAEWHPHAGCWMAWPCHVETWKKVGLERARKAYARVIRAIAQFEPVMLLINPQDKKSAEELCSGDNIHPIPLAINDSWTRDTGPTFLINHKNQLAGVDWIHNAWGGNYTDCSLDNKIPAAVLQHVQAQHFTASLVMEGGSFHVDGQGTLITTEECLLNANRNPHLSRSEIEEYLKNFLGITKVIWLRRGLVGDETDGHVDEVACYIAPGKILCMVTSDKEDENYFILQENLEILKSSLDAKGRSLEIVTVEQPPAMFLEGERLTLSYINFYLANQGIVMPAFGFEEYDRNAKTLLEKSYPNYKVIQVDALDIFAGGGGIHCITQQQPIA